MLGNYAIKILEKLGKIELPLDNMFKSIASEIWEQKGSLFCILLSTLNLF